MRISVITPTADQPTGIRLAERYMAAQTVRPHEWIVADDGAVPAALTMGQKHLVRKRTDEGARSLASNMLAALDAATGDVIVVWEHDDAYLPGHLAACLDGLSKSDVHGCSILRYYHVGLRVWCEMRNKGSALCQTAFRRELIPDMRDACHGAYRDNSVAVDWRFWQDRQALAIGPKTVIGIKGLPGRPGLGIGHRPKNQRNRKWGEDPSMKKLREWIGEAWKEYESC